MESLWIILGIWGLGFVLSLFGSRFVLLDESMVSVFAGLFEVIISLAFYFGVVRMAAKHSACGKIGSCFCGCAVVLREPCSCKKNLFK